MPSIARWGWAIAVVTIVGCGGGPGDHVDGGPAFDVGPGHDGASREDAGPAGCRSDAECADTIDCTSDTCAVATGICRHTITPALCAPGESCNPMTGCEPVRPCATSADCMDTDACTTMEACDPRARVCTFVPLDGDADGEAPRVCGGTDCDDSDAMIYVGASERCNTFDDDCDGRTDEGLETSICSFCRTVNACHDEDMIACYVRVEGQLEALACGNRAAVTSALGACTSSSCSEYGGCREAAGAMCACPAGRTFCGGFFGSCADTTSNGFNCGSCSHVCPTGTTCTGGTCTCPSGETLCGSSCTDTTTDYANCGSCGHFCPSGSTCTGGTCVCPSGQTACGTSCTDTATDYSNCGMCGHSCTGADVCDAGACSSCGHRDDPCCLVGAPSYCDAGLECGFDVPAGLCIRNDACWFTLPDGSCSAAESCFVSISFGHAFCATRTATLGEGAACTRYTDCAHGFTCYSDTCQRVCDPLQPCPTGATCTSSSGFGVCEGAVNEHCWFGSCTAPNTICNASNLCDCQSGSTDCGGACVSTSNDPMNCGSCGHACGTSEFCMAGACIGCGAEGGACCPSGSPCMSAGICDSSGICRRAVACDAFAQTGCRAGEACYVSGGGAYCAPAGSGTTGSACSAATGCAPGLGCAVVVRSSLCEPYCDTADGVPGCPGGASCNATGIASYGICRGYVF